MWRVVVPEFTASNEWTDPHGEVRGPWTMILPQWVLPCRESRSGWGRGSATKFIPHVASCLDRMGTGMCHAHVSWLKPTSQMVLGWLRRQGLYRGRCSGSVNTTCTWEASTGSVLMLLSRPLFSVRCIKYIPTAPSWLTVIKYPWILIVTASCLDGCLKSSST